jgi:hypothetical protein
MLLKKRTDQVRRTTPPAYATEQRKAAAPPTRVGSHAQSRTYTSATLS